MARAAFQTLRIYQLAGRVADVLWNAVMTWSPVARDTVGTQLIRAADSIGANIAEGYGRGAGKDNQRFVRIARGSMNETLHFLRRAYARRLITAEEVELVKPMLDEIGPKLNAYLRSLRSSTDRAAQKAE